MFAIFLKRNNWMYGNLILYNLAKEMFLEPSYLAQNSRNVVYTRWGKKSCPSNAELVHSGKYPYYYPNFVFQSSRYQFFEYEPKNMNYFRLCRRITLQQ